MDDQGVKETAALARSERFDVVEVKDPRTGETAVIGRKRDGSGGQHFEDITGKLDAFLKAPIRRKGTAAMLTAAAFAALVNRHKDGDSAIFATVEPPVMLGVIDYNRDVKDSDFGFARFGQHRVKFEFPISDQFKAWKAKDGNPMQQAAFAEFIEDHIADLVSPNREEEAIGKLFHTKFGVPAELMTLSRGLAIRVDSVVKEVHTIQSGEAEILFSEEHKPGSGSGKLTVPGLFVTSFPLFDGEAPTRAVWRLRYRMNQGRILWVFQAYRLDEVVRDKVLSVVGEAAKATGLPAYLGSPEA